MPQETDAQGPPRLTQEAGGGPRTPYRLKHPDLSTGGPPRGGKDWPSRGPWGGPRTVWAHGGAKDHALPHQTAGLGGENAG